MQLVLTINVEEKLLRSLAVLSAVKAVGAPHGVSHVSVIHGRGSGAHRWHDHISIMMVLRMMRVIIAVILMIVTRTQAKCKLQHLGLRNYVRSDTIVSATVMSFYLDKSGGVKTGKIKIRRVFKGDASLEGRLVLVQGFGDRNICLSNPRLGDTKLFFLKMGKTSQDTFGQVFRFTLNDNILKINLRNLKTLTKLRDRRKRLSMKKTTRRPTTTTTAKSSTKASCDAANYNADCIREPRAIQMLNDDTRTISVTPVTLPLLPPPVAPAPPPLCSFKPCEEGGTCEEHDNTFTCHCAPGRAGKYCELSEDTRNTQAGFTGTSYISLSPQMSTVTRTSIELSFRTFHSEGILVLWLGHTDWLSVAVVRGYVEVSYELGSGFTQLVSSQPVSLGQWHSLVFRRYHRDAMMQLDKGEVVTSRGRGMNKSLNIKADMFIGGHPYSNSSK